LMLTSCQPFSTGRIFHFPSLPGPKTGVFGV
jgi:hypothetical protein